jgi:hypothetical protein
MKGLTLDAGALIAYERSDRFATVTISEALLKRIPVAIPAGVLGEVWRDGRRQARLSALLKSPAVQIEPLDGQRARAAGQLCGLTGTDDVIDASVVLCARQRGHKILTSDPDDLFRLDPEIDLEEV